MEEVELLRPHRRLHRVVRGPGVVSDSEIADAPLLFPPAQRRQMGVPVRAVQIRFPCASGANFELFPLPNPPKPCALILPRYLGLPA